MHLVLETNGETNVTKAKYLRGSGLICQLIDSNTFYYLFNPHGDVVQRADQSGNLSTLYDYDAFGNNTRRYNVGYQPTDGLDTDPNPFRYCGEYFDSELGELYLRNRNYNSASGRFTTEDPIRDGKNWYGYCAGNPVRFVDSLGLYKQKPGPDYTGKARGQTNSNGKGGDHSGISSPDYWNNQQYIYDNNVYTPVPPPAPEPPMSSGGGPTPYFVTGDDTSNGRFNGDGFSGAGGNGVDAFGSRDGIMSVVQQLDKIGYVEWGIFLVYCLD